VEGLVQVSQNGQQRQGRQRGRRERVQRPGQPTLVDDDRQHRSDQDGQGIGVGPEVLVRVVLHCAGQAEVEVEREGGADQDHGERGQQSRVSSVGPDQGERPEQVELLLDRERPGVVEVVPGGERVVRPVEETGRVADRGAGRCEDLPDPQVRASDQHDGGGDEHDHHQSGPETRDASSVERPKVDAPGLQLAKQQRGDQVAGQAEEHRHADEAVDQRPRRSVLAQDQEDGHATEPVQRWEVTAVVPELVAHGSTLTPGWVLAPRCF